MPDDRWLEGEDRWRRWQTAALGAAGVVVVVRVLTVDPIERVPGALAIPAFALAGAGAVCGIWALVTQRQDTWQIREDWKGRARRDRREALAALRAGRPVPLDFLDAVVRFARFRATSSRTGGWVALMSTGTFVTGRSYLWSLILAALALALGAAATRLRSRCVEQYRTVRAQQDAAAA